MRHFNSVFLEKGRPGFWISCRSENYFYVFLHDDFHDFINIRIEHGHIDAKWLAGGFFALLDMLAKNVGIHRSRANDAETAGIADRTGQFPTAGPDHSRLDKRIINVE